MQLSFFVLALSSLIFNPVLAADDLDQRLTLYRVIADSQHGPWVLILPGGGYVKHAVPKEGAHIASALNKRGVNAAVLHYLLPRPDEGSAGVARSLRDVRDALVILREEIGGQRLGVLGFSAGGHLAAMTATNLSHLQRLTGGEWRGPDFIGLVYPVITLSGPDQHQGSTTALLGASPSVLLQGDYEVVSHLDAPPPMFVVHGRDDLKVPFSPAQSLWRLLAAREQASIFMIEVVDGTHGFALRPNVRHAVWFDQFVTWVSEPLEGHHYETTYLSQP